ncbi:MAG: NAD-dependent epimerase/dehydratase family protein [Pseudomonadota bacterium]
MTQHNRGQKRALVCGAGGFIGAHLVKRLQREGYWVRGVDQKYPPYAETEADDFILGDLRDFDTCKDAIDTRFDEVYQLAADMGGAGYIFTGENDADVMRNSSQINLNVLEGCKRRNTWRIFYASSACVYPEHRQRDAAQPGLREADAYPAAPDSEYGWEKLFSERLYLSYARNHGFEARIARYHNIFGPEGAWCDGREKAPAALCRKVATAPRGGEVEIWGDGGQTRSFLYIDECVEGTLRLMRSNVREPINIGSDELISINGLALLIGRIAGKELRLAHTPGPLGVRGRNSDNTLITQRLGWRPTQPLQDGLAPTYAWIAQQVEIMRQREGRAA